MKTFSAIASVALIVASVTTGCLIVPTPHCDSGYARTNVVQHTQQRFVPGQTTRAEVIMALGEPDAVSRDEHQLAYRSEKVVALWVVAAAGGYSAAAAGGTIYRNRFYVFEFDAQERFQSAKQTGQWGVVQGADESQLTPPVFASTVSNQASAVLAGNSVLREYPRSVWLSGADVARWKSAGNTFGQRGHLFCTESNLSFQTEAQFANTEPVLQVPFASMAEVHLDKNFFARRLVARLKNGEVHAFLINKPGTGFQDKPAMQAVCDYIQSKIKPPQLRE